MSRRKLEMPEIKTDADVPAAIRWMQENAGAIRLRTMQEFSAGGLLAKRGPIASSPPGSSPAARSLRQQLQQFRARNPMPQLVRERPIRQPPK